MSASCRILSATGTLVGADTLKELGASKMADEALAGLDEGALRKLVSSPITVPWGGARANPGM